MTKKDPNRRVLTVRMDVAVHAGLKKLASVRETYMEPIVLALIKDVIQTDLAARKRFEEMGGEAAGEK